MNQNRWYYAILDDQGNRLNLREVLRSEASCLSLVRYFDKGTAVLSRTVTLFDVTDYGAAGLRNVECFHLCSRVMGHDGAIMTARSLMAILSTLHQTSTTDPTSALASLREGDIHTILSDMDARLRTFAPAVAA